MGRRVLTDKERTEIKLLHRNGKGVSKNLLAMRYGVTRATIRYVVDPQARAIQLENQRKYQAKRKLNQVNEDK